MIFSGLPVMRENGAYDKRVEKLVKHAVNNILKNGSRHAFSVINNKSGEFNTSGSYVWVYNVNGKSRAHAAHPEFVGSYIQKAIPNGTEVLKTKLRAVNNQLRQGWATYTVNNQTRRNFVQKIVDPRDHQELLVGAGYEITVKR